MNSEKLWKKYEFRLNQTLLFNIGFVQVWVKHIQNGWLVKNQNVTESFDQFSVEEVDDILDNQDLLHCHTGKSNVLYVLPALPVKSVVFRNNKNLKISAGESTSLYLKVPVNLQFYFQEVKEDNKLVDIPLKRLSDTWFGEIDSGEPAFSIGSNYDKALADVNMHQWEAMVAVDIVNNTSSSLDLQRLILHVDEFSLYIRNNRIIASHATIDFKGQEQDGGVNLSVRKEIHGDKAVLIAKPRNSDSRNILRRSFFFIKNIYQN